MTTNWKKKFELAELTIKDQTQEYEAAQNIIKSTRDVLTTTKEKLNSWETYSKQQDKKIAEYIEEINSLRNVLHQQELQVAKVTGYLTRVQEKEAPPPNTNYLVEVPKWMADSMIPMHHNRPIRDWAHDMGQPQYKEPKWFEVK